MRRAALVAALFAVPAGAIAAPVVPEGEDPKDNPDPSPYRAVAMRATPGTPEIDGRLDEAAWALADAIGGFTQRDPDEGEPATERTEAWVLYDDGALYVGVRAYDSEPDKIVGQLTRRDQYSSSDWIIISIDSYYDRRTAFEFRVNPAGVERDSYRFDDTNSDDSWNAVWDVKTSVDEQGWVAEFRIPLSQLRFSRSPEQVWGFNITRTIQRKNETDMWKPISKDAAGWVSEYGDLAGLNGIQPKRRLEILPYVVAQQGFTPKVDGNPFQDGTNWLGNAGADVRYGLNNNLSLNLTLNPDFGQVEADPSVVNLSAFESFFSEKRPFFLEGRSIFDFRLSNFSGAEQLFYSRRVGRRPQGWADPRGGYVDYPMNTTILGAAKLSGKSASGWSLGVLDAVTAEEQAQVIDVDGVRHRDPVEPLTNYMVARVSKDFRGGQSALGSIFTATNRSLTNNLDYLRRSAYTGGVDGRTRFAGGDWEVSGQLLASYVRGSMLAMEGTQLSSARYFQRPDATHLTFDPTRTSLFGTSGALALSKIGGGHWRGEFTGEWVSPGFETNDLGYQRNADVVRNAIWVQYRELTPGKIFRRYYINYNLYNMMTFGGERTTTGTNVNGSFTLLSYWGGHGGMSYGFPSLYITTLRGGPAMRGPASYEVWGGFYSDDRKPVYVEAGGSLWQDVESSRSRSAWLYLNWRPTSSVRLSMGPNYWTMHDDWKYVTTQDLEGDLRYFTGILDQKTISLTTRLDWTFTPNLSLQLYAQPYIASGAYSGFDEVVAPKAAAYGDRFDELGEDRLSYEPSTQNGEPGTYHVDLNRDGTTDFSFADPNFSFKQLRSTVVLRWEYMPGSTLFFVWSQSKTAFDFDSSFSPARDFRTLFDASGDNIFSIKVNYYINP
ncbi:MAG TPA: DUF5916 domain-containing protein [Gemmatimonadota bacterium]|nr:DUF5916 domain-containing protein [Gemmatimonadota bacterium]